MTGKTESQGTTDETVVSSENSQREREACPALADRKQWEAGAQLVVPLAQLTMDGSLSGTEGRVDSL